MFSKKNIYAIKMLNTKLRIYRKYWLCCLIKVVLPRRSKKYNLAEVKKILIIGDSQIGDMTVITGIIRNLSHAGYQVYVLAKQKSLDIVKYSPYVTGTFVYDNSSIKNFYRSIKKIRKVKFDLTFDPMRAQILNLYQIFLWSFIKSKVLVGFNKSSIPQFNISISYYNDKKNEHVTQILAYFLALLKVDKTNLNYDVFTNEQQKNKALLFINKFKCDNRQLALLNPFGSTSWRYLSDTQIQSICLLLKEKYKVIFIGEEKLISPIIEKYDATYFKSSSILDVVPLIEYSDLVVTVDTSIVHLSTCFNKRTIAYYLDPLYKKNNKTNLKESYTNKKREIEAKCFEYFNDGKYIKKHLKTKCYSINTGLWAPNNPNASQLIFNYDRIDAIPLSELINKTRTSL